MSQLAMYSFSLLTSTQSNESDSRRYRLRQLHLFLDSPCPPNLPRSGRPALKIIFLSKTLCRHTLLDERGFVKRPVLLNCYLAHTLFVYARYGGECVRTVSAGTRFGPRGIR
jgi:hypothetical protein